MKGNTDWWGFGLLGYQKELNSECSKRHPGKIKYMYSSNLACRCPVCIICNFAFLKACEVLSLTTCLTFSPDSSLECHYYGKRFETQLRPPSFCRQTVKHIPVYIFQYVFLLWKLRGSGKDNEMMHMKACQKP